ncbi:HERV-H LTR-associating protein 1 homolog [Vulpes lagopus]
MTGLLVPSPPVRLCVGLTCVLSLWNTVSAVKGEAKKEKVMTFLPTTVSVNKDIKKEKEAAVLGVTVSGLGGEERKEKGVAFLDTTELPARSVDLSALNLTELVNGMLSRALKVCKMGKTDHTSMPQRLRVQMENAVSHLTPEEIENIQVNDTKKFFSLLSITSYSSFAFYKFSVAIYNISNLKTLDPDKFPTRYCYCLNNRTNDLSVSTSASMSPLPEVDHVSVQVCYFTALLVDVIGNSTSYLTEIFKSTSILSVSQTNESDCIFICVMTGKSGRNLSDFWEMAEKSPVINYTFTSSMAGVLGYQEHSHDFKAQAHKPANATEDKPPARSPEHQGICSKNLSMDRDNSSCRRRADQEHRQACPASHQGHGHAGQCFTHPPILGSTRRLARTPWVTTDSQARTPTLPTLWAPGGPPWEMLSSTLTSPAEATATRNLSGPPSRTAATPGSSSQASPTSGSASPPLLPFHHTSEMAHPISLTLGPPPRRRFATFARDQVLDSKVRILKRSLSQDFMNMMKRIAEGSSTPGTQTPNPTKAPAPKYPQTGDLPAAWPPTTGEEPALVPGPHHVSRCPQVLLEEGAITAAPLTLAIQKLNPCLMELCRFFQQCLCTSRKRDPRTEAVRIPPSEPTSNSSSNQQHELSLSYLRVTHHAEPRELRGYCLEYYSWFLKNATYICQRVKQMPHSQIQSGRSGLTGPQANGLAIYLDFPVKGL